jgi:hypothetical protein
MQRYFGGKTLWKKTTMRIKRIGHEACMEDICRDVLVGKPYGKRPPGG